GIFCCCRAAPQGRPPRRRNNTQPLGKEQVPTRYCQSTRPFGHVPVLGVLVFKLREWLTAYKLENNSGKKDILAMYLNTVSFSNNAYGIKTVARRYVNKEASELSATEAAVLVGMLKGTTRYNPVRNPERSLERRNVVLGQMHKAGMLTEADYEAAVAEPLGLRLGETEELGN